MEKKIFLVKSGLFTYTSSIFLH